MHTNTHRPAPGFQLFSVVVTGSLIAVLGILLFVLAMRHAMAVRDAQRLADVRTIQAAFALLYQRTGSYAQAALNGCDRTGATVAACAFPPFAAQRQALHDPGKFAYTIAAVPSEQAYAVTFVLERTHAALRAGQHRLTEQGIE